MPAGNPVAVSHVTQGTYQREIVSASAQAWTSGTEFEVDNLSTVIVAGTASHDDLFTWVKMELYLYIAGTSAAFEWMVIRMDSGDALPDLNTSSVVEELQKDKRIMKRGFYQHANPTYANPPKIKFALYNVSLRYGEEIRLVVRPLSTTADQGTYRGLLEWRQVGV